MKFNLLFLLAFFYPNLGSTQNDLKPTRTTTQYSANASTPLSFSEQTYFFFDNNGHQYNEKGYIWNGTDWTLKTQTLYTTDPAGNVTEKVFQENNGIGGTWKNSHRNTYIYNGSNQVTFSTSELWKVGISNWQIQSTVETELSATGKVINSTFKTFVGTNINFATRNIYTYDSNDRNVTLIAQVWSNGAFVNNQRVIYHYNSNEVDYFSSETAEWDFSANDWADPEKRLLVSFSPNQRIVLEEVLLNNEWEPYGRYTHQSDDNELLIISLYETWDTTTLEWVLFSESEYSYNVDQSISKLRLSRIDSNTDQLFTFLIVNYDYEIFLGASVGAFQAQVKLIPNPAHDFIQVSIDNDQAANLRLYDTQGRVVQEVNTHSNTIQISLIGQSAGTYFLQVTQGGEVKVLPLMKY